MIPRRQKQQNHCPFRLLLLAVFVSFTTWVNLFDAIAQEDDKNVEVDIQDPFSPQNPDDLGCDDSRCDYAHGTCLVDTCHCDAGFVGEWCNEPVPLRSKCWIDPDAGLCRDTPIGRFRAGSVGRTQRARACEQSFWERRETSVPVRNAPQLLAFQHFQALPSDLGHVLEIGAGPYTKLRLILEQQPPSSTTTTTTTTTTRRILSATLVDPLIHEYLRHPNISTSYHSNGTMCVKPTGCIPTVLLPLTAEEQFVPSSLESKLFDTVILVNTLEHCVDAVRVLERTYRKLRPGGVLVFGEGYTSAQQLAMLSDDDKCHPIQLYQEFFESYLHKHFVPLLPPRTGYSVAGIDHEGAKQSIYAIVRKKDRKRLTPPTSLELQ